MIKLNVSKRIIVHISAFITKQICGQFILNIRMTVNEQPDY